MTAGAAQIMCICGNTSTNFDVSEAKILTIFPALCVGVWVVVAADALVLTDEEEVEEGFRARRYTAAMSTARSRCAIRKHKCNCC